MKCPKCGAELTPDNIENKTKDGKYYSELQCDACGYTKILDEVSEKQLEQEQEELN